MTGKREGWRLGVWRGMEHDFDLEKKSPEPVKTEKMVTSYCCDIRGGGREEQRTCMALGRSTSKPHRFRLFQLFKVPSGPNNLFFLKFTAYLVELDIYVFPPDFYISSIYPF